MASISEPADAAQKTRGRRARDLLVVWNRKLHFYVGLYFILFLWLFSFTGLVLNHPRWSISNFWLRRQQSTHQQAVHQPLVTGDFAEARDLMGQLGLHGEIEWTTTLQAPGRFDFRVVRPGHVYEVKTNLTVGSATVQEAAINTWGILHVMHTFSGVRLNDPRIRRNWIMTTVWALSMDALAVGLIFMVCSSVYMWYGLKHKRRLGFIVLSFGIVCCGLFVTGLRWMV